MNGRGRTVAGAIGLALLIGAAILADLLALHPPAAQHAGYVYAPPMLPRIVDDAGRWRWPFVYPLRLENRLERRFAEDRGRPMPLRFRVGRPIVSAVASSDTPWFPLGTDALGRDVWSRLVLGARVSLAVAFAAAAVALLVGSAAGALAGYLGGAADDLLMWAADVMIALPAIYVVLALRAAAPLVLAPWQIFWIMVCVFALAGWPPAARAVRSVIAAERTREYAEAARSIGAGTARLLLRHLLPAARGVLTVQAALLLPAFVLAEATLSFVGLGFGEPISSWGLMLQDAGRGGAVADAPWLLAPAVAIALLILSINLVAPDATIAGTPVPLQRNSR